MSAHASKDRGPKVPASPDATRFIVMASAPLAVGFGLLGVEAIADATEQQLEQILEELVESRQSALVFVEDKLARGNGRWLKYVRDESSNIVLVEIPQLHGARDYESAIEGLIQRAFGRASPEPHH